MALVIRPNNRQVFAGQLDEVYRIRRKVFIDRLNWSLPEGDGVHEIDQFDSGDCMHLVALGPDRAVRGTSRITASEKPNVTCDVLGPQMSAVFPRAPHIAEVSRLCLDPALGEEDRRAVLLDLRISQMELCAENGWSHWISVVYSRAIQLWIRTGMKSEILGPPFAFPGDREFAFPAMCSEDPGRPNALINFLGARSGALQDPDREPSLLLQFASRAIA